ncbi:MAG TPA: protease complex subunit PrcB family protein [Vicinamibacterales bacterium]|nr:protease complex subunit PrcB family protein [Vicinamibacterales bacterium]
MSLVLRVVALSCVSWLAVAATASAQTPRTIDKGEQSNIDDAKQVVIRDAAAWRALWQQHAPDRPMPAIDFSKESVVAVFLGSKPTAGYNVTILSTTEGGGALIVRYRETRPSAGGVTAQVLTFPYHIIAIPKASATNVKFEKADE